MTGFERQVELYSGELWRFCLKLCGDAHDAEDLYQDTWAKALKSYGRYEEGTDFRRWVFTICVNTFRDSGRKKYNTSRQLFRNDEEKSRFLSSIPADERDIDAYIDLHGAIRSLPKNYRAVITLFYFREFTLKEISEILSIPEGTVNSRLNTARKLLKRRLSHE